MMIYGIEVLMILSRAVFGDSELLIQTITKLQEHL